MTEEKNITLQTQENTLAANEEPVKKPGLMRGARDFIENTLGTLKGKDLSTAVEEFTSEMTLVAEGLSEDANVLRQNVDKLSADLTLLDERTHRQTKAREADEKVLSEEIGDLDKRLGGVEKRLEALEKMLKEEKKPQKLGVTAMLRQATWMVGIFSGAWVVVTILKLIGG